MLSSGAHKPTSLGAQRVPGSPPKGHPFISAASPEENNGQATCESYSSTPAAPNETRPPCQGCTDSKRQHLPQSKSDRQMSDGQGKEQSCRRSPRSSELALAFKLQTSPLLAACALEQTTIKTIAQKHTLMCPLTSTNSCLHCLAW